jgi:hypothetical protein
MPRLFPLFIIIILIFIGGIYFTAIGNQAQSITVPENSTLNTGWGLLNTVSGFATQQYVIIGFVAFLILFVGCIAVLVRSGGE